MSGRRGSGASNGDPVVTTRVVVVAAPASGSGKTTVATGMMAALARRGTVVAPFKVGPDYIDPGYHGLAAGRVGRNLDPVLVGERRIGPLLRHGAVGAEIAVVEGVMGLFDGRLADGYGSTAQVAAWLRAPVVLVVDCRGQSRSLAALLHGFASFDPGVRVAGVVLNRVGSPRHEAVLREAAGEVGVAVLGAVPRRPELVVPSRHLGLVTAVEHGAAAVAAVDAMAELAARYVDLDAVLRLAAPVPAGPVWDPATELTAAPPPEPAPDAGSGPAADLASELAPDPAADPAADPATNLASEQAPLRVPDPAADLAGGPAAPPGTGAGPEPGGAAGAGVRMSGAGAVPGGPGGDGGPVVAVAGGPAFTFGYAEHTELLAAAGARVVVVDPLRDEQLPAGTAGLVLPGGFPEEHVAALAANARLRAQVAALARSGAPVLAECGGLLYLCAELDGAPMCGVLAGSATMTGRLTLGYRDAVAVTGSPGHRPGERVAGHEFHRCTVTPRAGGTGPAWAWRGGEPEGFVLGGVHASFLHLHPAGAPRSVARFVAAARSWAGRATLVR